MTGTSRSSIIWLAAGAMALVSMSASALCTDLPGASKHHPIFIRAEQLDVRVLLPNPPANDSPETKAELRELHEVQDMRTPAQVAQAQADDREEDIFIYRSAVGQELDPLALPLTAKLSAQVHNDDDVVVSPTKSYFARPRPFMLDSTLHPVCKHDVDYSYPSGHSTTGYLEAFLLAEMVPEKREAILKRADEYAYNRVVCGVHFPGDVHASRMVAAAMFGFLMESPGFLSAFHAAREETRRALRLPLLNN